MDEREPESVPHRELPFEHARTARVQWSLQSLFYWTLMVSVALALLAPFLRAWTPQQRKTMMLVLCVELVAVAITGWFCARSRKHVLREAGGCFFRTSFRTRVSASWRQQIPLILNVVALLAMQVISIHLLTQRQNSLAILPVLAGQLSPLVIAAIRFWALVWGVDELDVELCEHGLIRGAYGFLPWGNVVDVRPSELRAGDIVQVTKTGTLKVTSTMRVAAEVRDEVIERIRAQMRAREAPYEESSP